MGGSGEKTQGLIFQKMSLAGWLGGDLQSLGGKGWGLNFVVTADSKARDDSDILKRGTVLFVWLPGVRGKEKGSIKSSDLGHLSSPTWC